MFVTLLIRFWNSYCSVELQNIKIRVRIQQLFLERIKFSLSRFRVNISFLSPTPAALNVQ